ncbi:hypothetical protein V8C35DRAFT_151864 [Trichoderma chlorosporum]
MGNTRNVPMPAVSNPPALFEILCLSRSRPSPAAWCKLGSRKLGLPSGELQPTRVACMRSCSRDGRATCAIGRTGPCSWGGLVTHQSGTFQLRWSPRFLRLATGALTQTQFVHPSYQTVQSQDGQERVSSPLMPYEPAAIQCADVAIRKLVMCQRKQSRCAELILGHYLSSFELRSMGTHWRETRPPQICLWVTIQLLNEDRMTRR